MKGEKVRADGEDDQRYGARHEVYENGAAGVLVCRRELVGVNGVG